MTDQTQKTDARRAQTVSAVAAEQQASVQADADQAAQAERTQPDAAERLQDFRRAAREALNAAQGPSSGRSGDAGCYDASRPGPQCDPNLARRFSNREVALHGKKRPSERGRFMWNGKRATTDLFDSLDKALKKAVPIARPTTDDPSTSSSTKY